MTRDRAMRLVAIATGVCAAILLVAAGGPVWLRVLVGIPFVLLLPGQATLLFVDPDGRLGGLEWATWSVGISIAVSSLVGMGLAASLGLTASAMIVALTLVTLLALVAAQRRAIGEPDRLAAVTRRNPVWRTAFGAIVLLTCTLAILLISTPGPSAAQPGKTVQLWGLPDSTGGGLRIGADNIDASSKHYRLTVEQGGQLISQQSFDLPAGSRRLFVIKKSATWTRSAPVTAVLADADGVLPSRTISVWPSE
jgi:hypothetical protein